jgi:hypothetical protein
MTFSGWFVAEGGCGLWRVFVRLVGTRGDSGGGSTVGGVDESLWMGCFFSGRGWMDGVWGLGMSLGRLDLGCGWWGSLDRILEVFGFADW